MEDTDIKKAEEEKKKKSKGRRRNIIFTALAILIMIGVGISYYVYWEDTHYFSTENAKVTAKLYSVVPAASGKLVKYTVAVGSRVKADEVIGRVENGPYIKAPFDGEVVKSDATLNGLVSATSVIAVIADTGDIYVGANIEETDITKIKVGQNVIVNLDAYNGKGFKAHVSEIDQVTQTAISGNTLSYSTSGTYTKVTQLIPIKVKIDDDVSLNGLIGTNATIKIRIK